MMEFVDCEVWTVLMFTVENRKMTPGERLCHARTLPTIAVSRGGRVFISYLCGLCKSGERAEGDGARRAKLVYSDGGERFDTVAANVEADEGSSIENARVWISPDNRLFLTWSCLPEARVRYCVCDDADAQSLEFGETVDTPLGTLLARPVACADGVCLFASGVTDKEIRSRREGDKKRGVYIGRLADNGDMEICNKLYGNASVLDTICLVENKGKLESFIRVPYGIEKNVSSDGAATFSGVRDSGYGGYGSRFAVSVLPTDNFLLMNTVHLSDTPHMTLTAMLSRNGGRSFEGIMPVYDGEGSVSAPDVCAHDGVIYSVFAVKDGDTSRIFLSKFTEDDILRGEINDLCGDTKVIF